MCPHSFIINPDLESLILEYESEKQDKSNPISLLINGYDRKLPVTSGPVFSIGDKTNSKKHETLTLQPQLTVLFHL